MPVPQRYVWPLAFLISMTVAGCGGSSTFDGDEAGSTATTESSGVPSGLDDPPANDAPASPAPLLFKPDPTDIADVGLVYEEDGYGNVDVIRVDVRTETTPGVCSADDYSGCTLADVLGDIQHNDDYTVDIPVHFKADDYPEDGSLVNAQMRQRGGSTRKAPQKSFRIRLDDKDVLWRTERSLLLNKHPYEATRIRNKLSFDLMSDMPYLMSSRTQFVNLWIDDGQGPVDYGLFTHVEAPGKRYLQRRGLNEDDRLYKVGYFQFSESDLKNVQVDATGKPLDKQRFETSLEIESGEDHRKLVEMLSAFHDPARSFESVLAQYFNANNVLTWITLNLLVHQTDAITHNFILYNPVGSDKFYFLPWDYDGTFSLESEPPADSYANQDLQRRLFYGYARGRNSRFVTKYYRQPGIHQRIIAAADVLRRNYLSDAEIAEKADRYAAVVDPYLTRSPDSDHNPNYSGEYAVASFPEFVAGNEQAISTRFSVPMPPELNTPELSSDGSRWIFSWSPAYDVTGHTIAYDLEIASSLEFRPDDIVLSSTGIADSDEQVRHAVDAARIPTGRQFVRLIARPSNDPQRFWQVARNSLNENGTIHYGVVEFAVP